MNHAEVKRYHYLFTLLGALLIMASGLVSLVFAVVAGTVTIWFLPYGSLSTYALAVISAVLALVGIFLGFIIIGEGRSAIEQPSLKDHWVRLIILSIVAFIVANGFVIGAALVFLAGLGGFAFESGLIPCNLIHFGTRVCPDCGLVTSQDAKFCASCGRKFSP